ncbi:GNAT family N-acetyltransferase [Kitasatospora indigofera]|uniref:GNAT family N-acetyltransferase n=1 Tax=Kitasatospora indigofera TaxID=67307 RepID=UPI0036B46E3C
MPDPAGRTRLLPQYFGVLPDHRGHGHGWALWQAAMHRAPADRSRRTLRHPLQVRGTRRTRAHPHSRCIADQLTASPVS